jgi:glycine/D-amino acid oxidase-like deaminating enzyme
MSGVAGDVVVVGGGIMGCASAYFLARRGLRVAVIEADASYRQASSALSASSIRQQFSTPACIAMSRFGFEFLSRGLAELDVPDEPAQVDLVERGYLYLASPDQASGLEAAIAIQNAHEAEVSRLNPQALKQRFPWLHTDDLALGAYGESQEGWFDGYSLLQAFRRAARGLGVEFLSETAVGLDIQAGRVQAVITSRCRRPAAVVVNAAGFRAGEVARWAGFEAPIAPERRCVFVFDSRDAPGDLPLVIDPSGVYVRPEGRYFIAGGPATPHPDLESPCFDVDYDQFESLIWPTLAARSSAFEAIKFVRAWAGQYEMNLFDHNALIGWTPGVEGMVIVAGFSGHGMQHAPAAGRGVAELIVDGRYTSLDLSALDPDRLRQGRPIEELNVI